jgi:hypothetical protein
MLLAVVVGILFLQPDGPLSPKASSARSQDGSSQKSSGQKGQVTVSEPVVPVLTGPARDLPSFSPEPTLDREINPRQNPYGRVDPDIRIEGGPDPLLDLQENASPSSDVGFGTPIYIFD